MNCKLLNSVLIGIFSLCTITVNAADFKSGETIVLDSAINNDVYLACKNLTINGPIKGDVVVAAQNITIDNTVEGDFSVAAEMVTVNGEVKDDIRNFSRIFNLKASTGGDLIVFSGECNIAKDVIIHGDLVVFSGDVVVDGNINGNVIIKGGKITLNGKINGNLKIEGGEINLNNVVNGISVISANTINMGNKAHFNSDVKYWRHEGQMNIAPSQHDGSFVFDKSLKREEEKSKGVGIGTGFIVWNILSGILLLILLVFLFPGLFARAGLEIGTEPVKSFGLGILYLVLIPVACILLMFTLIGIPLGIMLFFFYMFTLISGLIITSLVLANFYNERYQKQFSQWKTFGMSILILIILHLILVIPLFGFLLSFLLVISSFGALLDSLKRKKKEAVV